MRLGIFASSIFAIQLLLSSTGCASSPAASQTNADLHDSGFDLATIADDLAKEGLTGSIHGVAGDLRQYVFTLRNPSDFMQHLEISLFTTDPEIRKQLAALKRHDKVKIKGTLASNPSAQPHIKVEEVKITKAFSDPEREKLAKYAHSTDVAGALKGKTEIEAVVHAVAREGKVLVVEYGDAVIPVVVTNGKLTEKLGRGDNIRLHFKKQTFPRKPTHLELDETVAVPIEHLESLVEKHGEPISINGDLIYFPVSPQINGAVFAIKVTDINGTSKNYTLIAKAKLFEDLRERCLEVWKKQAATQEQGRNYLVNLKLRAKATGKLNYEDRGQANPQIALESLSDLELTYDGVIVP